MLKRGAASFTVGMPNYPAVYAIRAGLEYIERAGVDAIADATEPLVAACIDGLAQMDVELLTPRDQETLAGIVAFRHPAMNRIHSYLQQRNIHVMTNAGRVRVSIHGYNTLQDVETFLRALGQALRVVG